MQNYNKLNKHKFNKHLCVSFCVCNNIERYYLFLFWQLYTQLAAHYNLSSIFDKTIRKKYYIMVACNHISDIFMINQQTAAIKRNNRGKDRCELIFNTPDIDIDWNYFAQANGQSTYIKHAL